MKQRFVHAAVVLFAFAGAAFAQVPADAPAGSTGVCKDGSYSSAATKRGACAGHHGVKTWYSADATPAAKTTTGSSAPPAATAGAPVPPTAGPAVAPAPSRAPTTAAAGGGNGQVWVNTSTKVYHCEGDRYYGKTKAGSYMSESAAVAAGDRPDHGKACKAG